MQIFPTKVVQKIKIHAVCSITPPHPENLVVYDIQGNVEKYGTPTHTENGNIIRSMHFACCIAKEHPTVEIPSIH
jgi:hypothetical protein